MDFKVADNVSNYFSTTQREKGMKDFVKKTEAYDVASFKVYEVKNVLLFYVHEQDLSKEVPYHDLIQNVINDWE